jgi:hypothetical protein
MNLSLRTALLAFVVSAAPFASVACSSDPAPSACDRLNACCALSVDPSSCSETAMSVTDDVCEMNLVTLEQNGTCPVDGGVVEDAGSDDGGADADAHHD